MNIYSFSEHIVNKIKKFVVFFLIFLLIFPTIHNVVYSFPTNDNGNNGFTLFSPMALKTTYLIDSEGSIINIWNSEYTPGIMAYMIDNGCIIRAGRSTLFALAGGGHIQKISWWNELIWDFTFASDNYIQHHDIEPMPNGNVLLLAREIKTRNEAIQAGRIPNSITRDRLETEFIVEVKPTGPTSGEIVWEWHAWDHIIQDYDDTKENFGVVKDHPELLNINYWKEGKLEDWLHVNSIDYNQELDQIILCSRNFDEIWIIDHSTTIEEASGHIGGKIGMGGDILYRWGNPITYNLGTLNDQKLFEQHDAQWIEEGCPGEGNIIIYNNGVGSVDEIIPPVDENGFYYKTLDLPYGPSNPIWRYKNLAISSPLYSGIQRLPNGNTLICSGVIGYIVEVTYEKNIVWEYLNPFGIPNSVFKARRYYEIFPDSNPPGSLTISGSSKGKKDVLYNFTIKAIDPENDNVYYIIDWGDGSNTGWIGPFSSGEEVIVTHFWLKQGTYIVKLKAKDVYGIESEWTTLEIIINKNKSFLISWFIQLLDRYPRLFPLLREILKI